MDAEYLKENIGDVLASALSAVVISEPVDPVDYLARWLLNHIGAIESEELKRISDLNVQKQDEEAAQVRAAANAQIDRENKAKADEEAKKLHDLNNFLATATSLSGLMDEFAKHLKAVTGASAVYIGRKEASADAPPAEEGGGEEGEEADTSNNGSVLKYIAATEGHEFMLENKLLPKQGVTFRVFKQDAPKEEEPADEDEEGGKLKPKKVEPEKEDNSVFVQNVLMGEDANKMHFWRLPNLGSYFAMRCPYEACLNEKTLEEAMAKETSILEEKKQMEEEAKVAAAAAAAEAAAAEGAGGEGGGDAAEGEGEGEGEDGEKKQAEAKKSEAPAEPAKVETEEEKALREKLEAEALAEANEQYLVGRLSKESVDLVVCLDTMEIGRRLSDDQVALAKGFIKKFKETLLRIDSSLFKEERLKRRTFAELEDGMEEPSDDDKAAEKANLISSLEKAGLPCSDADVQFKYRQGVVWSLKATIAEFRAYNVFRGPIQVLQALFYMLDYKREDFADVDNNPVWNKIRMKFNDELFHKIQNYDPRKPQMRGKTNKYATLKALKGYLKGHDYESLKKKNFALAEIFGYVNDALEVKNQATKERKEAKKAEAEAAAGANAANAEEAPAEGGDEAPEDE